MAPSARLRAALAAIDDANRADPTIVTVRDRTGPKEIVHADLVTEWVRTLKPDAGDALLLAARGHHFRRWTVPRASYPTGRAGYLRWRKDLHAQHAAELGVVLADAGYDDEMIAQVQSIVRKDGLARAAEHDDVQVLEDALCLVFLETQLMDIVARLDPATLPGVITKTAAQDESPRAAPQIADVPLGPGAHRILDEAFATRRRGALPRRARGGRLETRWRPPSHPTSSAWARTATSTADATGTSSSSRDRSARCPGYELVIVDVVADGNRVAVELNETVDDGDARLHTDETVVFDVAGGLITRVAVYLQTSERLERGSA